MVCSKCSCKHNGCMHSMDFHQVRIVTKCQQCNNQMAGPHADTSQASAVGNLIINPLAVEVAYKVAEKSSYRLHCTDL